MLYVIIFIYSNSPPIMLLKPNATDIEIIEALRNPINGVSFINPQNNLPSLSFVTTDAVSWLMAHMEGVTTVEKAVQVSNIFFRILFNYFSVLHTCNI